jgi:transcription-repair coupling factor (superfamily II helicase)
MHLKVALRELRALGCEATAERVTLHLASGAPIDPEAIGKAVAKKGSPWKLSPDMRLSLRLAPGEAADGLAAAEKALEKLAAFRKA